MNKFRLFYGALMAIGAALAFVGCDDDSVSSGRDSGESSVDTLYVRDTLVIKGSVDTLVLKGGTDTLVVEKNNTDTLVLNSVDTLVIKNLDTVLVSKADTVVLNNLDTLVVRDTVYLQGLDGVSCTTAAVGDTAVMIVCGEDTTYVRNGKDFEKLDNGMIIAGSIYESGSSGSDESCTISDVGAEILFQCGSKKFDVPKAICNGSSYNPDKKICYNGRLFPIDNFGVCRDVLYTKDTHFCYNRELYEKCGGTKEYYPPTELCENNVVKRQCNGIIYDSETHFCSNKEVHPLCNGSVYTASIEVCEDGEIKRACDGVVYDKEIFFCGEDKKIHPRCGGYPYDTESETCIDGKIMELCGTGVYDHNESYCYDGKVFSLDEIESSSIEDERDGNSYTYSLVGNLYWMMENLKYNPNSAGNTVSWVYKKLRYYHIDVANEVCPAGSRLPTKKEADLLAQHHSYKLHNIWQDLGYMENEYMYSIDEMKTTHIYDGHYCDDNGSIGVCNLESSSIVAFQDGYAYNIRCVRDEIPESSAE